MTAKIINLMSKKVIANDISSTPVKNCELHRIDDVGESTPLQDRGNTFSLAAEKNAKTKERLKAERAKDNEITMKAYGIK